MTYFQIIAFQIITIYFNTIFKKSKVSYRGGGTKELFGFKYKILRRFLFKYTIIKKKNVDFNKNY